MMLRKNLMAALIALTAGLVFAVDAVPDGAKGFAGMLTGKVITPSTDQVVIEVTKIEKTWKHSTATSAESLVGKQVALKVVPSLYAKKPGYQALVAKFFAQLKAGDVESFDCKQAEGDGLTFLELTKGQKEKVEAAAKK